MNKNIEKAVTSFSQGFNCAQSVFSSYAEEYGIDEENAKRIASGFGGGFGRLQKTCGAVTGALMLISARYYDINKPEESKELVYNKIREYIRQYEKKNGSIECLELLGIDMTSDKGYQAAKEQQLFKIKCENYVRDACEIFEDL